MTFVNGFRHIQLTVKSNTKQFEVSTPRAAQGHDMSAFLGGVERHLVGPTPRMKLRLAAVNALLDDFVIDGCWEYTVGVQVVSVDDLFKETLVNSKRLLSIMLVLPVQCATHAAFL